MESLLNKVIETAMQPLRMYGPGEPTSHDAIINSWIYKQLFFFLLFFKRK